MANKNEINPDRMVSNNFYYQKRLNLDTDRNKLNLEKTSRKKNETQAIVGCDHTRPNDKCQVRNISYEELEEFHDRYTNCPGSVNKRIFMATYLEVDSTELDNKKDIKVTCYCPRKNGKLDIICQKSFLSILGVSKHRVLGIGQTKLLNGEFLFKEKRGGDRRYSFSVKDEKYKNLNENKMNYSNENSQNHSNSLYENESTLGSDVSENRGFNTNKRQFLKSNEDNGESNRSSESNKKSMSHQKKSGESILNESNEDDNAIFETKIHKNKFIDDDDMHNDQPVNIFQPVVQLMETDNEETKEDTLQTDLNLRKNKSNNNLAIIKEDRNLEEFPPKFIRNQSAYESVEERMAARQKARAILENLHSQTAMSRLQRPPNFNQPHYNPHQMNRFHQSNPVRQSRNLLNNYPPANRIYSYSSPSYMGPENWRRTLEKNVRRRQRMQEVKIDCNHNLTRVCKVISVPHEDLVKFHHMFWDCQGLVEERIFLAKYMVVTPCNHRREMAIATRIPTSDGQLVEVCQKSFLSVVGITKHKVQAAARAKLKGTLFKQDGRIGPPKPLSQQENSSEISSSLQIPNLSERYSNKEIQPKGICQNETIEIDDSSDDDRENNSSNKSLHFDDSHTGNGDDDEEDDSEMISVEDAFANGKLNYEEFRKNIEVNKLKDNFKVQLTKIKQEINLYKRRTKKLMLERKNYIVKLTKLQMENIKLKRQQKILKNINKHRIENNIVNKNKNISEQNTKEWQQNYKENNSSIENATSNYYNKNIEQSNNGNIYNEMFHTKTDQSFTGNYNEIIPTSYTDNNTNFDIRTIKNVQEELDKFSNEIS